MTDETLVDAPDTEKQGEVAGSADQTGKAPDYKAKADAFYAERKEILELAGVKNVKELKEKLSPKQVEKSLEKPSTDISVRDALKLQAEGYSQEEILKLHDYATRMGIPMEEVAKDDFIKSGIESNRAKKQKESANPAPSHRTFTVKNKTFGQMSLEERKANFASLVDSKSK